MMKRDFAGDVSKESAVLGWIVDNTKDEDDPTENKKAPAATTTGEVRKENDAPDQQQQGPKKIRTPKQEVCHRRKKSIHTILHLYFGKSTES